MVLCIHTIRQKRPAQNDMNGIPMARAIRIACHTINDTSECQKIEIIMI